MNKWIASTINSIVGLDYKKRESTSEVFDTVENRLFVNADLNLPSKALLYGTYNFISGDVVSGATPTLQFINWSDAIEPDDAFGGTAANQFVYRMDADTSVITLGYNQIMSRSISINLSYQLIDSEADGGVYYYRQILRASADGSYVIRLTANSSLDHSSASDELTVLDDNMLVTAPGNLTYHDNIEPFMLTNCTGYQKVGGTVGIHVWWTADATQPLGIPATTADSPSLGLYEQVRTRVNLEYIEDSQILKNPSGNHHGGGLVTGLDASQPIGSVARTTYDIFVNWISEGAVCGGIAIQCP